MIWEFYWQSTESTNFHLPQLNAFQYFDLASLTSSTVHRSFGLKWVQNHNNNHKHYCVQNCTDPLDFSHDFEPLYKYFSVRFYYFIRRGHFAINNSRSPFKCAQSFLGFDLFQNSIENILIKPLSCNYFVINGIVHLICQKQSKVWWR